MSAKLDLLPAAAPKRLRLLKGPELVRPGDYVEDGLGGYVPWEGPSGFRADAFVKPTYRRYKGSGPGRISPDKENSVPTPPNGG